MDNKNIVAEAEHETLFVKAMRLIDFFRDNMHCFWTIQELEKFDVYDKDILGCLKGYGLINEDDRDYSSELSIEHKKIYGLNVNNNFIKKLLDFDKTLCRDIVSKMVNK